MRELHVRRRVPLETLNYAASMNLALHYVCSLRALRGIGNAFCIAGRVYASPGNRGGVRWLGGGGCRNRTSSRLTVNTQATIQKASI